MTPGTQAQSQPGGGVRARFVARRNQAEFDALARVQNPVTAAALSQLDWPGHSDSLSARCGQPAARACAARGRAENPQESALARRRGEIVQWPLDRQTAAEWPGRWQNQRDGRGVFLRSSSNLEDLPGFSGTGRHTTVPNVLTGGALAHAVKTLWTPVFNFDAWAARCCRHGLRSTATPHWPDLEIDCQKGCLRLTAKRKQLSKKELANWHRYAGKISP